MLYLLGVATGVAITLVGIYAGLVWRLRTMWR